MATEQAELQLLAHARSAGCNAVAIRTSNIRLVDAISRFHGEGMKVFGWRWPARRPVKSPPNYFALDQARYIATTLIPAKLDGFYADIESDADGGATDWDNPALAPLAHDFCKIIMDAAPANFVFSITAGCAQPTGNPNIPWSEFSPYCETVMPQTYWRWQSPTTMRPQDINGGSPRAAVTRAAASWSKKFPGKPQIPIMGELIYATPQEISAFGAIMKERGVSELHAYTDGNDVPAANLEAMAAI